MDLFSLLIGFSVGAVSSAIITSLLHSDMWRDEDIVTAIDNAEPNEGGLVLHDEEQKLH